MTTLTIRNLEPAVKERLRARAAKHGRSLAAEARHILADAVGRSKEEPPLEDRDKKESGLGLAEAIRRRFAPYGGVELELPPREIAGPPRVKFEE